MTIAAKDLAVPREYHLCLIDHFLPEKIRINFICRVVKERQKAGSGVPVADNNVFDALLMIEHRRKASVR